jgi:23S rRNA (pseudouridine1915-N3)-methyltransferase
MKLAIAAIGLLKQGPELELARDYEQRIQGLGRQAGVTGLAIQDWAESRAATPELRKGDEATRLWSAVPPEASAIVLDERGQALTSAAFAALIKAQADQGTRQLSFLIGGPDGHAPETRSKAFKTLSFGPMTYPHRLLRVLLLEQIYRAVTILVNHPYHRA